MSDWQDIETAPQDGTLVRIHFEDGHQDERYWAANGVRGWCRMWAGRWLITSASRRRRTGCHSPVLQHDPLVRPHRCGFLALAVPGVAEIIHHSGANPFEVAR